MSNTEYPEIREALDVNWCKYIIELGFLPVILSINFDDSDLEKLGLSGVIFTGGNDLSILCRNQISIMRDDYEKKVFTFCKSNKLPMLGVCRGMQFLMHLYGDIPHKITGHVTLEHLLYWHFDNAKKYHISKLYKVNSFHNYGLTTANDCWDIIATSKDGVIEAVVHKYDNIMAHMWHPEREKPFDRKHMNTIKNFFRP